MRMRAGRLPRQRMRNSAFVLAALLCGSTAWHRVNAQEKVAGSAEAVKRAFVTGAEQGFVPKIGCRLLKSWGRLL